jgi:transforming growth factor-beta-induced protein
MVSKKVLSTLVAVSLTLGSLLYAVPVAYAQGDIVDVAVADGRFTTLVAAVQAAGLVDTLKGEGPFTVFAPTDDAFAKLPEGTVEALLADIPALTNILLYHVVAGEVKAADVVTLDSANTALNKAVLVTVKDGRVFVNDAQVVITDVEASNGVIHVVDTVLLPPADYAVKSGDSLYHIAADLLGAGSRYHEIVALTNAMHALDASYPMIEHPDLLRVGWKLAIPGGAAAPMEEKEVAVDEALPTIVDIAVADGRFTTLVAALQAAGLVETLQGEGPFTVFAPTDDAFAKLPEGTVEGLLADIPTLTDILLYHVVPAKVLAADVVELDSANTVLGKPVAITVEDGAVMINESKVVITDIEASNGVIHVIDAVLLPPKGYEVMAGDTLYKIASRLLGDGERYKEIVELTNEMHAMDSGYPMIEDPNVIRVGWKLAIP